MVSLGGPENGLPNARTEDATRGEDEVLTDFDVVCVEDDLDAFDDVAARGVLCAARATAPVLIKHSSPGLPWRGVLEDEARRSFAYALPREDRWLTAQTAARWFDALHPRNFGDDGAAWTGSSYRGEPQLRKTCWCVLATGCSCEYGYSDTWQPIVRDEQLRSALVEVTAWAESACGLAPGALNSCNLNWYERGGGIGFHADDEFLFDGLRREVAIVSLSLCEDGGRGGVGRRRFLVRAKRPEADDEIRAVDLGHGDLLTMEGLHQLFFLHAVWPGDSHAHLDHPLAQGERINITWRTIVRHLDGSAECRGQTCPLSC